MWALSFLSLFFLLGQRCLAQHERQRALGNSNDIILPALQGKTGPTVALFFAQGASIGTAQYKSLLQHLQEEVPFPLWIGIPQCMEDNCAIPLTLTEGVNRVRANMITQGMRNVEKNIYAGHSLGGAMLPDFVAKLDEKEKADGMVLLGAFIPRSFKTGKTAAGRPQVNYPVPSLTIGGELDGLCRVTRIAEALYTQVIFSENPADAVKTMAVTIVEKMNHMQFASGTPPTFVADHDIQPEITEEEAHNKVVYDFSQFLNGLVTGDAKSWSSLSSRVDETITFAKPITDAFLMEGYFQYLPPCFCETTDEYGGAQFGTCESTPSCNGGCPWMSQYGQAIMGGVSLINATIKNTDSIHIVTEEKPSCHLPHIHKSQFRATNPNWANPGSIKKDEKTNDWNPYTPPLCDSPDGCELTLTSVTEPSYLNSGEVDLWRLHFDIPFADTGFLPISANELKTKLKSREAVWQAAGVQDVSSVETDMPVAKGGNHEPCGEINQAAIDWAAKQLSPSSLERYQKYGQKLLVGPDIPSICPGGPCWIWDPLRFNKNSTDNTATVHGVYMFEPNKNMFPCGEGKAIPCPTGFHYCKLLSPARALEWMMVDGLKNTLSTKRI